MVLLVELGGEAGGSTAVRLSIWVEGNPVRQFFPSGVRDLPEIG